MGNSGTVANNNYSRGKVSVTSVILGAAFKEFIDDVASLPCALGIHQVFAKPDLSLI